MTDNLNSRLLTVEQVALYLGKTKFAIYNMVNRGQLPYIKMGNGKNCALRFDAQEIQELIDSRRVQKFPPVKKEAVNV